MHECAFTIDGCLCHLSTCQSSASSVLLPHLAALPPCCCSTFPAAVSDKHLVKVVAQLAEPLGLVLEFAEGQPIAEKPNLQVCLRVWKGGEGGVGVPCNSITR